MKAVMPKGKYKAILADPAWKFKTFSKDHHGVPTQSDTAPYKTMTLEEMKALPVAAAADTDCALFMWVIDSHLTQAIELAAAWGFKYKTIAFVWKKLTPTGKDHVGMGYWSRKNVEICLLFTRGKPKRISKSIRQLIEDDLESYERWITAKRRQHSRKPEAQYERVEALVGGPYLELFARKTRPGWSVFGDEVTKFNEKPKRRFDAASVLGESTKSRYDIMELLG